MTAHPDLAALDRLKTRIQGLRCKTTDNGCTESEALLAAAKVAELLDRYDLSLTDVEIRDAPCEQREYETYRKKRIPPARLASPNAKGRMQCEGEGACEGRKLRAALANATS